MDTTFISVKGSAVIVQVKNERGQQQSYNEIRCRSEQDAEALSDKMALDHRNAQVMNEIAAEKAKKPRTRKAAHKPNRSAAMTPEQLTAWMFKK